jgi:hypothetical protein
MLLEGDCAFPAQHIITVCRDPLPIQSFPSFTFTSFTFTSFSSILARNGSSYLQVCFVLYAL